MHECSRGRREVASWMCCARGTRCLIWAAVLSSELRGGWWSARSWQTPWHWPHQWRTSARSSLDFTGSWGYDIDLIWSISEHSAPPFCQFLKDIVDPIKALDCAKVVKTSELAWDIYDKLWSIWMNAKAHEHSAAVFFAVCLIATVPTRDSLCMA